LPSFALIFLSDGKPSDRHVDDTALRYDILSQLALRLRTKLSFCAVGLGASSSDFSTLADMISYVKSFGAEGTFEYAQLSTAKLSQAFSSMASSMTATRTEMLSVHDKDTKKKKNILLRDKHIPQEERRFKHFSQQVSRWRYDHSKFEQRLYPWRKGKFKNRDRDANSFDIEDKPFGEGSERLAYMFFETDSNGKRLGKPMVAKESNRIDSEERKVTFHGDFCRVQHKASELAAVFNKTVKKAQNLRPIEKWMRVPEISFLECHVYEYIAADGMTCGLLVEQYLKGKFTKYNGNNGFVSKRRSGPTIDLHVGTVYLTDFLQAFLGLLHYRSKAVAV